MIFRFSDCPRCLLTLIFTKGLCEEESHKYFYEERAKIETLIAVESILILKYETGEWSDKKPCASTMVSDNVLGYLW